MCYRDDATRRITGRVLLPRRFYLVVSAACVDRRLLAPDVFFRSLPCRVNRSTTFVSTLPLNPCVCRVRSCPPAPTAPAAPFSAFLSIAESRGSCLGETFRSFISCRDFTHRGYRRHF